MSKYYFYHPLGENCNGIEPSTYEGHGIGKLDMDNQEGRVIYSMSDGTVVYAGTYSDGTTCLAIETNCAAISPIVIRYLHGDWDSSLTAGAQVKRGQKIGTENGHGGGSTGAHLHVDISSTGNGFIPICGTIDNKIFTAYAGKDSTNSIGTFIIDDKVEMQKVETWRKKNNQGNRVGYNWLIFASAFVQNTGSE